MKDFFKYREELTEKIVQRTPRGGRFVKSEPKKSAEEKRAEETFKILRSFEDVSDKGGFTAGSWKDTILQHAYYATKYDDEPNEDGELIFPHAAEQWEPVVNNSKNLGKISVKVLKAANIKTRSAKYLLQVRADDLYYAHMTDDDAATHYLLINKNRVSGNPSKILASMDDMFYLQYDGRKIQPKDVKSLAKYY